MTVEDFAAKLKEMLRELANKGILVDHISINYHQTLADSSVDCIQFSTRGVR